ncbi:hypothetical protein S2M10_29470 [Sphingomonas sp. S2M10]|uniref:hypothetical protein n=1 Tax=Sphingomonas sp. S2M10 TaxID=2705010 RepID=UPI001456E644|nr:hypothetical protein [Sphingomonas sp. S2M10]NLS27945.1 hypothetical protein [Sphingomonas sp. S2M10]
MDLLRLAISNCLGGGYAAHAAGRVFGGRGCAELGDFFGLALAAIRRRLDVGAEGDQAEAAGGCLPSSRRFRESDGFPPFFAGASGDVARRDVARHGQGPVSAWFFRRRRQIANLTTRAAGRIAEAPRGSIGVAAGHPPFPLPGRAPRPQPGSVRADRGREIFSGEQPQGCALERLPSAAKGREISVPQMGSGVTPSTRHEGSVAKGAESSRQAVGQGEVRAHEPLDVGKAVMLRLLGNPVNGLRA